MLGNSGKSNVIGEGVIAHFDFSIGSFDVSGFKGRATYQTSISYDSQTPNVHLI